MSRCILALCLVATLNCEAFSQDVKAELNGLLLNSLSITLPYEAEYNYTFEAGRHFQNYFDAIHTSYGGERVSVAKAAAFNVKCVSDLSRIKVASTAVKKGDVRPFEFLTDKKRVVTFDGDVYLEQDNAARVVISDKRPTLYVPLLHELLGSIPLEPSAGQLTEWKKWSALDVSRIVGAIASSASEPKVERKNGSLNISIENVKIETPMEGGYANVKYLNLACSFAATGLLERLTVAFAFEPNSPVDAYSVCNFSEYRQLPLGRTIPGVVQVEWFVNPKLHFSGLKGLWKEPVEASWQVATHRIEIRDYKSMVKMGDADFDVELPVGTELFDAIHNTTARVGADLEKAKSRLQDELKR
jgi:hypothetical protein